MGSMADTPEKKAAVEGEILALSSLRDSVLLNFVGSPVVVFDAESILFANTALCDELRRTAAELVGTPLGSSLAEESAARVSSVLSRAQELGAAKELIDLRFMGAEGEKRWMSGTFAAVIWDRKKAVAGFLTNLEERKRSQAAEERFEQAQKMEAVGRLAGGVAHDMNNVLGAIMGFASVIQAELPVDNRLQDDVKHILESCRKGRDLMLNLLGFARRGKYRMEQFTLNERIEEVVKLLKHSIPKKIKIETKLATRPIAVYGDPTQIHHAIMNLCLNAVDAMGDTGVFSPPYWRVCSSPFGFGTGAAGGR